MHPDGWARRPTSRLPGGITQREAKRPASGIQSAESARDANLAACVRCSAQISLVCASWGGELDEVAAR
jgi:hypothetical protein